MSRKNAFSYVMWFIYSMTVCICLYGVAGHLCKQAGYSDVFGFGASSVGLFGCALLVFLMRLFAEKMDIVGQYGKFPTLVAEGLGVIVLIAIGIILRVNNLEAAGQEAAYFETAKVAEGQTIPVVVHGAVYIYLQLLHVVFQIFGNKFLAGIGLQIFLQMLASGFLYLAARKLTGRISALIMMVFCMVGPYMIQESLMLSPKMLFFAVFAVITYVCARCIKGKRRESTCVITGMVISVGCYLDMMGIILLVITVIGVILKRDDEKTVFARRFRIAMFAVLGCVLGFVALMLVDSTMSAKSIVNVIGAWFELFSPSTFTVPMLMGAYSAEELLLLLVVMSVGIFSFWYTQGAEGQSIWILVAILLLGMQCFGMTTKDMDVFLNLYAILAVLAGTGVAGMFSIEENTKPDVWEEKLEAELAAMSQDIAEEKKIAEKKSTGDVKVLKPEETTVAEKIENRVEIKTEDTQQEKPKVKYIENPLPLPKKHVKKVLDFDINPKAGQDDFDVRVDANDDFDI